jgi:hypothetical protein
LIALIQPRKARPLDGRDVNEDIAAAIIWRDEAKTLGSVEEFYRATWHKSGPDC